MAETRRPDTTTPGGAAALDPDELAAEQARDLPDREAMSILDVGQIGGGLPVPGALGDVLEQNLPHTNLSVDDSLSQADALIDQRLDQVDTLVDQRMPDLPETVISGPAQAAPDEAETLA
jgi:hypothetical protein